MVETSCVFSAIYLSRSRLWAQGSVCVYPLYRSSPRDRRLKNNESWCASSKNGKKEKEKENLTQTLLAKSCWLAVNPSVVCRIHLMQTLVDIIFFHESASLGSNSPGRTATIWNCCLCNDCAPLFKRLITGGNRETKRRKTERQLCSATRKGVELRVIGENEC